MFGQICFLIALTFHLVFLLLISYRAPHEFRILLSKLSDLVPHFDGAGSETSKSILCGFILVTVLVMICWIFG